MIMCRLDHFERRRHEVLLVSRVSAGGLFARFDMHENTFGHITNVLETIRTSSSLNNIQW